MIRCEVCNEHEARIHVTDVLGAGEPGAPYQFTEQHLCHQCAAHVGLPHVPNKPQIHHIWQLLGQVQKSPKADTSATCPDCGMTLAEFRSKGRLGCPRDYEVFAEHLEPLLERIHNASEHVGRVPGGVRARAADDLEQALEAAIEAEDYERAAELRDLMRDRREESEATES
jgi:protein arginine kinase activator